VSASLQEPRFLMGLRSTHLGALLSINPTYSDSEASRNISLHIIVPTVGEILPHDNPYTFRTGVL